LTEGDFSEEGGIFRALARYLRSLDPFGSVISQKNAHLLDGLWLARESIIGDGVDPFRSVMDLGDKGEAMRFVSAAGKKFDGDYLEYRSRVEEWLRGDAARAGVKIDGEIAPLYFTLRPKPMTTSRDGFVILNIPARAIPEERISFTIEDSFPNYFSVDRQGVHYDARSPSLPRVMNANEVRSMINTDDFPKQFDGRNELNYIEAQVWLRDSPVFSRARNLFAADKLSSRVLTIDA
jgi:hypothetical protein